LVLDTSFLIDLQREMAGGNSRGAVDFLESKTDETAHITLVTWMEFAEGYAVDRADDCRQFLSNFPLLIPDLPTAWRASRISRELRRNDSLIGDHDIWIAAAALERNVPVVTRNMRHFSRVQGLMVARY